MELQEIADDVYNELIQLETYQLKAWLLENVQDITVTRDCMNAPGLLEGYSAYISGYPYPVRIETSDSQIEALDGITNVRIHALPDKLNSLIEVIIHDHIAKI